MLAILLFSAVLACNQDTQFTKPPHHGMGVRFTRRGLEKYCQKGYTIIPDIVAALQSFPSMSIDLISLKLTITNLRLRAIRVAVMDVYLLNDNYVKMDVRNGMAQLSMRLEASILGSTAITDCIFTLKDFGAVVSMKIGSDTDCPYHLGMSDIKTEVFFSKLDIDAAGLNAGGSILANVIQGMTPALEAVVKNTVLKVLLDTIFNAVKSMMSTISIVVWVDDYRTDQRYINGINVVDQKIVADQGGYSMIINTNDKSVVAEYPTAITSPPPKTVYTDREYEFYVDREAFNSYLYVWHEAHDKFAADKLTVPYTKEMSRKVPGLAEALKNAGMLKDAKDPGADISITLAIKPLKKAAPHIPWLGAAIMPVNLTGSFSVIASKPSFTPITLTNIDGSMIFSSVPKLKKHEYSFTNVHIRAYLVFTDLIDITINKNEGESVNTVDSLLEYMVSSKYIPHINGILFEPGVGLLNGNFVNLTTVTPVYLCNEDRVLFVADIEKNDYFP